MNAKCYPSPSRLLFSLEIKYKKLIWALEGYRQQSRHPLTIFLFYGAFNHTNANYQKPTSQGGMDHRA